MTEYDKMWALTDVYQKNDYILKIFTPPPKKFAILQ